MLCDKIIKKTKEIITKKSGNRSGQGIGKNMMKKKYKWSFWRLTIVYLFAYLVVTMLFYYLLSLQFMLYFLRKNLQEYTFIYIKYPEDYRA